jgi:hypothetical protein
MLARKAAKDRHGNVNWTVRGFAFGNRPRRFWSMRNQKYQRGKGRGVRDERSALRSCWAPAFLKPQEMDGRAICRRGLQVRGDKQLPQIFSHSAHPGFFRRGIRGRIVAEKGAQEWIAHAQASVSASPFGPTTLAGGHQSATQKSRNKVWLPTESRYENSGKGKLATHKIRIEQLEGPS